MKYFFLTCIFASVFVLLPIAASAQSGLDCKSGQCIYTPLEPLPTGSANAQSGRDFPAFMSGVFKVLISFGGLFAVVMLVVAGIGYMLSESALDIDKAKSRAKAALWGLLLLTGSWLILNTINPKLLEFNIFNTSLNQLRQPGTPAANQPIILNSTNPTQNDITQCEIQGKRLSSRPEGWMCI